MTFVYKNSAEIRAQEFSKDDKPINIFENVHVHIFEFIDIDMNLC